MKTIEELTAEAEFEIKRRRELNDELEIKAQRATVPSVLEPGQYPTKRENRTLDLGDADKAFLAYLRTGVEQKALVSDVDGGRRILSPVILKEVEHEVENLNVIRGLSGHRNLESSDNLEIHAMDEVEVGWGELSLAHAIPEKTLTPAPKRYCFAEDLYGLAKVSENMLTDSSDLDLAGYVISSFARAVADAEELAFVKGAGHESGQPPGITLDTDLVTQELATDDANVIVIEDFTKMPYQIPARYRKGSCWLVNSTLELAIRNLRALGADGVTYTGPFLWQPSLQEGVPNQFLGYPIHCVDNLCDLSDADSVIAIFGNLKLGYVVVDRSGIEIKRLDEIYSEASLIGFRLHKRVGAYLPKSTNKYLTLLKEGGGLE